MISINPIPRALVPVDSEAAARVSAPNYDEFQGDHEVWELLQASPDCVLHVTMAHCDAPSPEAMIEADSEASLARAKENLASLIASPLTREAGGVLFVYEIRDPRRPAVRQIGLGGMARTSEIRTEETPDGPIIRNEGVREPKARGRARLIEATRAFIGTVNNAVPDPGGRLAAALEATADARDPDFESPGRGATVHRIWLVEDPDAIARLQALMAEEPEAYVADGNHRSAAAAMLGHEHFLTVFFTADRMGISPYNRLVLETAWPIDDLSGAVADTFEVSERSGGRAYQPETTHEIGLYSSVGGWLELRPLPGTFDPADPVRSIDHDIVQRNLFAGAFGIADPRDERLAFVGANKDAAWLQQEVDEGRAAYAVTLPAVTMEQFIAVCRHGGMMPPKSTWFEPKLRSGLVMALLDLS